MPKKKGGRGAGKGKLAKMTEEERLIYLEQQRLAEDEMRRKKEDLLMLYLKEKVAKEEKATIFNLTKLNHQWRNIMRETKSSELKKEIEILSQTFERIIDRKEAVIKSLAKDIEEAEEQYNMANRSHVQNIDALIKLQYDRLHVMSEEYEMELEVLREEFEKELDMITEMHSKEMSELEDIMFAMDQSFQEQETWMKSEFQNMRDELKNRNLEEKHQLRVNLEFTVESLWQQFQQALKNYNETTEERKAAFEALKAKDAESAQTIETQMKKIQKIQEQLSQIRNKMGLSSKENDNRNKVLKAERERMQNHFHQLKGQMNKMRDKNRTELGKLTILCSEMVKALEQKVEKGEKLLRIAEMCRKLETEEEKVTPFHGTSLTADEQDDVESAVKQPVVEKMAKSMHEYEMLENFWKRFNKVNLDQKALNHEKQLMIEENQQLRLLLKQYLDGISVNNEVLASNNPLLVVNNKSNLDHLSLELKHHPNVVIEAATHVKKMEMA